MPLFFNSRWGNGRLFFCCCASYGRFFFVVAHLSGRGFLPLSKISRTKMGIDAAVRRGKGMERKGKPKARVVGRGLDAPADIARGRGPKQHDAGQRKRCRGRVTFVDNADASAPYTVVEIVTRMFLEKLKRAGSFVGFVDPGEEDVGMLWVKASWNDVGLPTSVDFYIRKGGSRKTTHSKRQRMEDLLRSVSGTDCVSIDTIDNMLGDDPVPPPPPDLCEEPYVVLLKHSSQQQEVLLKGYVHHHTRWYELGTRRNTTAWRDVGTGKQHEQGLWASAWLPASSSTHPVAPAQHQHVCGACGYFTPLGVRHCGRCLSQLKPEQVLLPHLPAPEADAAHRETDTGAPATMAVDVGSSAGQPAHAPCHAHEWVEEPHPDLWAHEFADAAWLHETNLQVPLPNDISMNEMSVCHACTMFVFKHARAG